MNPFINIMDTGMGEIYIRFAEYESTLPDLTKQYIQRLRCQWEHTLSQKEEYIKELQAKLQETGTGPGWKPYWRWNEASHKSEEQAPPGSPGVQEPGGPTGA